MIAQQLSLRFFINAFDNFSNLLVDHIPGQGCTINTLQYGRLPAEYLRLFFYWIRRYGCVKIVQRPIYPNYGPTEPDYTDEYDVPVTPAPTTPRPVVVG